jgi:ferredoxin-NADP reductase
MSKDMGKYIQDVLEAESAPSDPAATAALLCGHKDMCQKVTALLTGRGVPAEKVLLNF